MRYGMKLGYARDMSQPGPAEPAASSPAPSASRAGRPRDVSIDARAAEAVVRLLTTGTYRELTLDRVAAEAGTSKPALRRRWGSLPGVVVHALVTVVGTSPTPDTGCLRCDLVVGIGTLAESVATTPVGAALPGLVADLAGDAELRAIFSERYFEARRATTRIVLQQAVERGEVDPAVDLELVLDLLAAPLYYRTLFAHQPIDGRTAEAVVDLVLAGVAPARGEHNAGPGHQGA